ncbi:MAG: flippase-like domain-containing protein, partial [Desulfobacterales bacterium]|nr:flippase-like domain-containing protein [Desulfobacterales bacterium]
MIIICFFIALPSVPGFWGIWEAGGIFALSLFGISAKEAAGFTLANHAIQIFPVIIIGVISAMLSGVDTLQILKERKNI